MDTWNNDLESRMEVSDLVAWLRDVAGVQGLDGITITGGEPFDQPEALLELLSALPALRRTFRTVLDVLVYSGYPHRTLQERFADQLKLIDVLIAEPYIAGRRAPHHLFGSANQAITLLTKSQVIRERYTAWQSHEARPQIQVQVDGDAIWFIGIPRENDLARLEQLCEQAGLLLERVSWRC